MHMRDSDTADRILFAKILHQLGGASATVEVHHFDHSLLGWFELILVDPRDELRVKVCERLLQAI
jgi:hypothetical protein